MVWAFALLFVVSQSVLSHGHDPVYLREYNEALQQIDWNAVKQDIIAFFTDSKSFWPADFGHYGPFMIRQAWHCAGSYRTFDGHGGCDGGRQRFDPERSWDDNTNLDKAKTLLWPLKQKYGLGLSWGDLIILAGTVAIEDMGGPVLGFCAGRIDDYDGSASVLLGPTPEQNETFPCPINGQCKYPLGSTTIGLIYLNPEGPMGQPNPAGSAPQVRDAFGRMDMDDVETVALIGGGHAFGKTHGACPLGPGPSPKEDPSNPWPGLCGTGRGNDTFTSGFEGPWTTTPTRWSNYYFSKLTTSSWTLTKSPGGHNQWIPQDGPAGTMMLTSDISLLYDPNNNYQKIAQSFASNISYLEGQFSLAWYKLVTRDMGPVTRCVGPWVPPAQPFQYPLPPPGNLPDFQQVRVAIEALLYTNSTILQPDISDGRPYYGAVFIHLAWQCASTFRHTDFIGGCNGARIRFLPQSGWPANIAMDKVVEILSPVKNQFPGLSWADLFILAGTVALDNGATSKPVPFTFCGGRTDATDGSGSNLLQPNGGVDEMSYYRIRDSIGLTDYEAVALAGRPRSSAQLARMGYFGSWNTGMTAALSNEFFITLLNETWDKITVPGTGNTEYKARGKELYILPSDIALRWDATTLAIAEDFASDSQLFLTVFANAWTKVVNIDRFDGPIDNLCDTKIKPMTL